MRLSRLEPVERLVDLAHRKVLRGGRDRVLGREVEHLADLAGQLKADDVAPTEALRRWLRSIASATASAMAPATTTSRWRICAK